MEGKKKTVGSLTFAIVPNTLAQNKEISLKAIGLYAHMTSRPEGWHFTLRSLSTYLKDGRASITSALDELKEKGWIEFEKNQDGSGLYLIHREPNSENRTNTQIQKTPPSENPTFRKPERIKKKEYLQIKSYYKERVEEIEISDVKGKDLEYFNVAKMFYRLFKKNLLEAGSSTATLEKSNWKSFVNPVRLMIEKDKITLSQFRTVYDFLDSDPFWKSNILSTNKLREKIPTLILQSKRNEGTNKNGINGTGAKNISADYLQKIVKDITGVDAN